MVPSCDGAPWRRWRRVEYYVSGALVFIHFALTTGTREALVLVLIGFGIATIMPCT
jgi:hypothetical protein